MTKLFSHLQVSPRSPISVVLSQSMTTVPAGEPHLCGSLTASFSPQRLQGSKSLLGGTGLPALSGEGAGELQSLIRLSSEVPAAYEVHGTSSRTAAAVVAAQVPGTLPLVYAISLPPVFKHPPQSLASKLHINWDSVGSSLCSSEHWLGHRWQT